jgi:hypothetical protein
MTNTICPYPGLRPFNEEESIFFKGREKQVERLVKRLEEKKFLMVNGASGDGKSSLIYAGVIPYAKAGFFKAKYNNWIVADFRPERSPLKNLTTSICKQLKIEDAEKTEKELGYGFSALCDLYKSSPFYIDETSASWLNADEKERKVIKRKGANLLVLVDQFEEFFTNPENYQNGIPSIESQKTVNVLLETYKLAAAHDLPIYVVCTMRSDYIGQCAAFRGLPEAIGYSQFFVPRLKRQEIEQVIEGPAELAGCRISKRLTQTLLNSLTDGFDQLPILQHALNHIWKAANNGTDELDLIHLAMVGGVSSKFLSVEDKVKFEDWSKSLPDYKLQLLEKPSLSNVLNAHANELYLAAHLHYKNITGKEMPIEQAQKIIKVVFQCLTKMDASRAVRNRMTLQEITDIINDEKINTTKVDQLLRIYREQGNTFLQPFIVEDGQNKDLSPSSVLDITHESLIRNWLQLTEWANEEFENFQNYLDFNKQLQRWVNSNENSGYLLPIGPLTYFENWFDKLNPSKYWINRYEEFEGDKESRLAAADVQLSNATNFIKKSAGRLFFSKTLIKYGGQKIATAVGLLLLIVVCSYYYFDYRKKQNDYVLNELLDNGNKLLLSSNVSESAKAEFLISRDRLNELSGKPIEFEASLDLLQNDTLAFDIGIEILKKCTQRIDSTAYDKLGVYSFKVYEYLFKNFEHEITEKTAKIATGKKVVVSKFSKNRINNYLDACRIMKFYGGALRKAQIDTIINRTVFKVQWHLAEAVKSNSYRKELANLDFLYTISSIIAIDNQPNFSELIKLISPLEGDFAAKATFDSIFNRDEFVKFNCDWEISYSGGYYALGLMYATQFGTDLTAKTKIETIIDSTGAGKLPERMKDLFFSSCKSANINKTHLAIMLEKTESNEHKKIRFLDGLITDLMRRPEWSNNFPSSSISSFISFESAENIFSYTEQLLLKNEMNDSTRMNLSLFYKKKGIYFSEFNKTTEAKYMYYNAALTYFNSVSAAYKKQRHYYDLYSTNSETNLNRFLCPGFFNENIEYWNNCSWNSIGKYCRPVNNNGSGFIKFLISSGNSPLINHAEYADALLRFAVKIDSEESAEVITLLKASLAHDKNVIVPHKVKTLIALYDSYQYLKKDKMTEANIILDTLFKEKTQKIIDYDFDFPIQCNALLLAKKSDNKRCLKLLNYVGKTEDKKNIILNICYQLQEGEGVENTYFYMNELLKDYKNDAKIGMAMYRLFGLIGGYEADKNQAKVKYRNNPELLKPLAIRNWVIGTAENGNYFKAKNLIPENVSETKELILINQILQAEIIHLTKKNQQNAYIGNWNDKRYFELDLQVESINNDIKLNSLE